MVIYNRVNADDWKHIKKAAKTTYKKVGKVNYVMSKRTANFLENLAKATEVTFVAKKPLGSKGTPEIKNDTEYRDIMWLSIEPHERVTKSRCFFDDNHHHLEEKFHKPFAYILDVTFSEKVNDIIITAIREEKTSPDFIRLKVSMPAKYIPCFCEDETAKNSHGENNILILNKNICKVHLA